MKLATIEKRKEIEQALLKLPVITGDMIFRFGDAWYKGVIPFSQIVCKISESLWSHVAVIIRDPDQIYVVDTSDEGVRKYHFLDWMQETYLSGSIEIRRLVRENIHLLPRIKRITEEYWESQPEYDFKFKQGDKKYYCAEGVDYIYRESGINMPDLVQLNTLPGFKWYHKVMCKLGGIDPSAKIVLPGNDKIGLASSKEFETVYLYIGENAPWL